MVVAVEFPQPVCPTTKSTPRSNVRVWRRFGRQSSWLSGLKPDNDAESREDVSTPQRERAPATPSSQGRKRSLLRVLTSQRRASSDIILSTPSNDGFSTGSTQRSQYLSPLHVLTKEAVHGKGRRWTPPLSPSARFMMTGDDALRTPSELVSMLKQPGIPSIKGVVELKKLVGAASRAWIRDFKIRGGRTHVHEKLREMERLEEALNRPQSFLKRKKRKMQMPACSLSEIVEVREELMQVLLFLHLRE